jgi:hypothetical protein
MNTHVKTEMMRKIDNSNSGKFQSPNFNNGKNNYAEGQQGNRRLKH